MLLSLFMYLCFVLFTFVNVPVYSYMIISSILLHTTRSRLVTYLSTLNSTSLTREVRSHDQGGLDINKFMMESTELHRLNTLKGISFAQINIRSLFGKLEDIIRITDLGDISVLGITETWLNGCVPDSMINIPRYD